MLTDALRAGLLRPHGYRAEVVEFVDSRHTPRNLLIRARRTGAGGRCRGRQHRRGGRRRGQHPGAGAAGVNSPGAGADSTASDGGTGGEPQRAEYQQLVDQWQVTPRLSTLLDDRPTPPDGV